jgi:exonuclease V gamma subunit
LELHCAPSAWRQVEALASRLQQAFQQDASLRPEDCLVLCVEPQVFANPLACVMQAQGWPCCWIAAGSDPAQAEHEQVQRSLLGVLQVSLADPRASELSQLLQDPGLRCALGVERASWPQIASVLDDLAAMRIAAATEALVLGMAAPSEASGGLVPWGASWAYTKAQSQPDAARAVLNLLDRLQSIRAWLLELPERSVEQWADGCLALLDRWPNDALAPWSIETLERFRQKLAELKVSSQHDGTRQSQPLLLDIQAWDWCVRSLLPASRGPLIRGHGLHVSAFGNLRSLPYRIIAVLGAQDGALPRSGRRDPFDPLGVTWQLCDPDPICADRAAWLEALLAAGDAFWVFRTDRDLHRGQAIGPSVLIDELMTFLSQRDPRLVSSISVEHGLVPTATDNPVEPARVELPQPPEQASSLPTVSLGQLSRDLKRPIRRWWKVRYGVHWPSTWVDPEDSLAADAPDPVLEQWLWFRWPDATSDHRLDRWPRLVHPLGGGSLAYEWRHALARDFKALNQLGWQLERPLMAGVALELEGVRLMLAPQPVVHAGSSSGLLLRAAPDKKWEAVLLEASLTHCARAVHGASAMTTSLLVHDGKVQMASTDLATAAGLLQSAISAWAGNGPEPAWPCFPVWWEGAKAKEENRVQAARNRWAGKGDKRAAERDRLEWRALAQRPDLEQVLEASETLYRPLIGLWQAL